MSWLKKQLGELCLIEKGKIGISKATPGEYPLVVTAEERLSHNEYHFEGNAVVIPLVSSTGHGHRSLKRIHYQSGKFAVGSILCVVMPKDETILRADYLYRFLELNKEKELVGRMRGMANVSLPMKEIALIEIPVPPLEEQIKFVQGYKMLEENNAELSAELNHQLDLVKQLRQAFLREAMQGKLVPQDPNDEPVSKLLDKIKAEKERLVKEEGLKKQKPLAPIAEDEVPYKVPESWVWCRLGEIISFGPSNGFSPKESKDDSGIKCLTLTATTSGSFDGSYFKYADERIAEDSYLWIEENDILLQRGNSIDYVGIAALCKDINDRYIYPDLMIKIRVGESLSPSYIHRLLVSPYWRRYFQENASGAQKSMPKINQGVVVNTLIALPPLAEQLLIVAKLDKLMQYCDALETSIQKSQQQNEMLLQQVLREALEPKEMEVMQ